jgi:hypothetical protein
MDGIARGGFVSSTHAEVNRGSTCVNCGNTPSTTEDRRKERKGRKERKVKPAESLSFALLAFFAPQFFTRAAAPRFDRDESAAGGEVPCEIPEKSGTTFFIGADLHRRRRCALV